MENLKINTDWFDDLLPEGIAIPSSTLISGPGGTGKQLLEFALVASWIKSGGAVIGIPLQYPAFEPLKINIKKLFDVDINDYPLKTAFIKFNHKADSLRITGHNIIEANMSIPEIWDEAIKTAENMVEKNGPGIMIFGSAINLLLLTATEKKIIVNKLKQIIEQDKTRSYSFSVSQSVLSEEIKELEDVADNLISLRSEDPMKLYIKISRMKGVRYSDREKEVPLSGVMEEEEMNTIAELDNCICYYCHCRKWGNYFNKI